METSSEYEEDIKYSERREQVAKIIGLTTDELDEIGAVIIDDHVTWNKDAEQSIINKIKGNEGGYVRVPLSDAKSAPSKP